MPSDPEADTPSGTVYQLPLDSARRDAAPRTGGGRGGNGGAAGTDANAGSDADANSNGAPSSEAGDSPIRSENNFGSSSSVPGVDGGSAGPGGRANGDGQADAEGGNGAGSGAESAGFAPASSGVDESGPSRGLVLALVGVIVLVGAGLGIAASHTRRQTG